MMQSELEKWNGPVGQRWALFQEALDARIRPYGTYVLERAELREGMRVLDVGAGCGDLTLEAARTVGATGKVVGVDISRPMLARARERTMELSNVDLREHDAATFAPDAPFDRVISRFGVMFFDDPTTAFANLRRATKPGGGLAFVCWQALAKNPWAAVPLSAVLRVVPPAAPPPPNAPGPFSLAEPDHVRDILTRAGWIAVELFPVLQPMKLGKTLDEAVEYATQIGPSARALAEADEATRARALEMLRQTLAPSAPEFALGAAVWVVTAQA
jgi:SAM-dependent methyltransferase